MTPPSPTPITPLGRLIARRIAAEGPITVAEYMALCLGHPEHGYYASRDPLGAAGDFTTAPEISQLFGELVGGWIAQVWADQGRPDPFVLAELGPGRGTLMRDALRAAARAPGLLAAARLWLVETSPVLRARQATALGTHSPAWADSVAALPAGPLIVVGNEFFDALPIRQFRRVDPGWQERLVGLDGDRLAFRFGGLRAEPGLDARFPLLPDGVIAEVSEAAEAVVARLAAQIAGAGGAALVIDYGAPDGSGDTLQAVRGHAPVDPLGAPGEADLTAHLHFGALVRAAQGVEVFGPVPQGVFLERLGITARARRLAAGLSGAALDDLARQHRRLTHPEEMGHHFQAVAFMPRGAPPPPGFAGI